MIYRVMVPLPSPGRASDFALAVADQTPLPVDHAALAALVTESERTDREWADAHRGLPWTPEAKAAFRRLQTRKGRYGATLTERFTRRRLPHGCYLGPRRSSKDQPHPWLDLWVDCRFRHHRFSNSSFTQ